MDGIGSQGDDIMAILGGVRQTFTEVDWIGLDEVRVSRTSVNWATYTLTSTHLINPSMHFPFPRPRKCTLAPLSCTIESYPGHIIPQARPATNAPAPILPCTIPYTAPRRTTAADQPPNHTRPSHPINVKKPHTTPVSDPPRLTRLFPISLRRSYCSYLSLDHTISESTDPPSPTSPTGSTQ